MLTGSTSDHCELECVRDVVLVGEEDRDPVAVVVDLPEIQRPGTLLEVECSRQRPVGCGRFYRDDAVLDRPVDVSRKQILDGPLSQPFERFRGEAGCQHHVAREHDGSLVGRSDALQDQDRVAGLEVEACAFSMRARSFRVRITEVPGCMPAARIMA